MAGNLIFQYIDRLADLFKSTQADAHLRLGVLRVKNKEQTMDNFDKALAARCSLALSRICKLDADKAMDHLIVAYEHAYALGRRAVGQIVSPSPLIASEPILKKAWHDGQDDAATDEAIANTLYWEFSG